MTAVHVILPGDIDDPATPSGGNAYDRRVCDGLAANGWQVHEHPVHGSWPDPTDSHRADLAKELSNVPNGALVLLDGLVASAVPDSLVAEAERLRLIVLVHLPLGDESAPPEGAQNGPTQNGPAQNGPTDHGPAQNGSIHDEPGWWGRTDRRAADERTALSAAVAVVTTSEWGRRRLIELYGLPAGRVHVATPGVQAAALAPGSPAGGELLCVAAVMPHKGHDLLVDALARNVDLPWRCVCVGALGRDPDFATRVRRDADERGLSARIRFVGPRTGRALHESFARADLLILPSRRETYGMVVTEALARGIPVLATATHGLPESVGRVPDGGVPGMLVDPDDPAALAAAVRDWLSDGGLRQRLRDRARERRSTLSPWSVTVGRIESVLAGARTGERP